MKEGMFGIKGVFAVVVVLPLLLSPSFGQDDTSKKYNPGWEEQTRNIGRLLDKRDPTRMPKENAKPNGDPEITLGVFFTALKNSYNNQTKGLLLWAFDNWVRLAGAVIGVLFVSLFGTVISLQHRLRKITKLQTGPKPEHPKTFVSPTPSPPIIKVPERPTAPKPTAKTYDI